MSDVIRAPLEHLSRISLATIHRRMAESSRRILKGDDVASMHLRMAHTPVLIRAASSSLLWVITTSFRHLMDLANDDWPAILTIDIWDVGNASAEPSERPRARTSNRYFFYQCDDYDASLDLETGEMYCVVKRLTNKLVAYPFRRVLWRWLARQELFPVQSAVIARGKNAVLLCGERGSGRSTAVLECLEAGWDFIADSQCGVSRLGDKFTLYSLFGCVELKPEYAANFPTWHEHCRPGYRPEAGERLDDQLLKGNEYSVLEIGDAMPQRVCESANPKAIIVLMEDPERSGPAAARIARRAATSALTADTRGLDRTTFTQAKDDYLRMSYSVPCFAIMRRDHSEPLAPLGEQILNESLQDV